LNEQVAEATARHDQLRGVFQALRARLDFDVPPGLIDPNIVPKTGDEGNDRMLEIVAREQPVRPAAVLIPVVDHPQPTVLLTAALAASEHHAGQISFPGGKIDATEPRRSMPAARGRGGSWPQARVVEPIGYLDLYGTASVFASCRRWRE